MLTPVSAVAQGCAQCFNNASSAPPQAQRAMRRGILILLLPTLSILVGFGFVTYRLRNAPATPPDEAAYNKGFRTEI
jgi:hypothetical protein